MLSRARVKHSGFILLFTGVAVLLFTFLQAFLLLMDFQDILESTNLINLFGEALTPLISYAIRALYLGIMGWIGSILTRRVVQIITTLPSRIWSQHEGGHLEISDVNQPQTQQTKQIENL